MSLSKIEDPIDECVKGLIDQAVNAKTKAECILNELEDGLPVIVGSKTRSL
jgi:hypothetical protein